MADELSGTFKVPKALVAFLAIIFGILILFFPYILNILIALFLIVWGLLKAAELGSRSAAEGRAGQTQLKPDLPEDPSSLSD